MAVKDKNKYGQYFTPRNVAEFMVELLGTNKDGAVLEPSCGEGIFLDVLDDYGYKNIEGVEYDKELAINSKHNVWYGDYLLNESLEKKYDAIIGNPPYIRWKNLPNELKQSLSKSNTWTKYCTSLSDYSTAFIAKAVNDLSENGVLVFITPEYWLYTAHSQKLRNHLLENGTVDKIYHFDESKLFDDVSASLIIFRFVKNKKSSTEILKIKNKKSLINTSLLSLLSNKNDDFETITVSSFKENKRWALENERLSNNLDELEKSCTAYSQFGLLSDEYATIKIVCDIANGMVTGLDKAFQVHLPENNLTKNELLHSISVAKAKQLDGIGITGITRYIFINEPITEDALREHYPNYYEHLQPYKTQLNSRYSYNDGCQYWEWSFLRNLSTISKPVPKIFVPCKERIGEKKSFRFTLVGSGVYSTQDVTALVVKDSIKESIFYIHSFLHLPIVTDWIKSRGVMRGGVAEFSEAPLASIPFKLIDWSSKEQVLLHNKITSLAEMRLREHDANHLDSVDKISKDIEGLFLKLLQL